jgi:hypothetical protein
MRRWSSILQCVDHFFITDRTEIPRVNTDVHAPAPPSVITVRMAEQVIRALVRIPPGAMWVVTQENPFLVPPQVLNVLDRLGVQGQFVRLVVVIPQHNIDLTVQTTEIFARVNPPEAEIPKVPHRIGRPNYCVPPLNHDIVHFVYAIERTTTMGDNIRVPEVGVACKE